MSFKIPLLVVGMLVSGCSNSLLTKLQDLQCVGNCDAVDAKDRVYFEQPVFQSAQMFMAEAFCWFVYFAMNRASNTPKYTPVTDDSTSLDAVDRPLKGWKTLLLSIPSSLDLLATTLMNVGLLLVPVSIYQMVRGSVVLFVGALSVVFLKRRISRRQWLGLLSVFFGVFLVGLSAAFDRKVSTSTELEKNWEAIIGVILIVIAQLFTASQFVYEEHLLEQFSLEPVKVVAWEGTFGELIVIVMSGLIVAIFGGKNNKVIDMFDLSEGLSQTLSRPGLIGLSVAIMFSMGLFNFCGLNVTRHISATSRSTIDTSRTVGVWITSLIIGWEKFRILQIVGFPLMVYGTLLFNGLIYAEDSDPLPEEFEHT